jgi:hypothetical protein
MTELAHIATPAQDAALIHRYLKLPRQGNRTVYTVYAKAIDPSTQPDGKPRVAFAREPNATEWFTRGIKWKFAPDEVEYGLFLNFVLLEGIEELELTDRPTPPYWFSSTWAPEPGSSLHQLCCTPLIAGHKARYHFRARLSGGVKVDPVIVVNPINTTGDGDDDEDDDAGEYMRVPLAALDGGRATVGRVTDDNYLVLTDGNAFTVNVKISNNGPVFSLAGQVNPPEFPGGVSWFPTKSFGSVTLTFTYVTTVITSLTPITTGLTFSQAGTGTQHTNLLTAPSPPNPANNYHFDVNTPTGVIRGSFDPVIVVNPINTQGDGD